MGSGTRPVQTKLYISIYRHCVAVGGRWGVWSCVVDHILYDFNTLFLTRFTTYKIAAPLQTKTPVKTTFRDWCLNSSFVHVGVVSHIRSIFFKRPLFYYVFERIFKQFLESLVLLSVVKVLIIRSIC